MSQPLVASAVALLLLAAGINPAAAADEANRWYIAGMVAHDDWSDYPVDAGPVLGDIELDESFSGGLALGWHAVGPLRFELEYFSRSADAEAFPALAFEELSGSIDLQTLMVNALFDLELDGFAAVPYAGVGAGWAGAEVDDIDSGILSFDGDEDVFAWQVMAGVAVPLVEQWTFSLDVRYLETEKVGFDVGPGAVVSGSGRIDLLSVAAGLRYTF
jgi:opacity protein-like surface antigen